MQRIGLLQRLESADEPLVLLVAPSGFGKTRAVSAAAGQGRLFPMLTELPLQEAGAHLLAGDLPAAAAALQHGTAPLSAPIVDEFRSPAAAAWVAFLHGNLVSAEAALDRAAGAAAEHHAVTYGVGQVLANLAAAGIHLERREHQPAAVLLAAARAAARINGRPALQAMVDTWIARLATAQGDRAGALASLAQARLALTAPDDRVRAQFALEEFRIALALEPAAASALIPQLPDSTASRLLQARLHVLRRQWAKAEQILEAVEPGTIRERVEWGVLRSLAVQAPDLTRALGYLRTALALASPHRYLATSSSRDPASPPCSIPCRSAPISSPTSMSFRSAQKRRCLIQRTGQTAIRRGPERPRTDGTPVAGQPAHQHRDRRRAVHICQHPQVTHEKHLPQARRELQGGRSPRG